MYLKLQALVLSAAVVGSSLPIATMTTQAATKAVENEYSVEDTSIDSNDYGLMNQIQGSSILHCWNWSYKTIEENMEIIAECGYTAVQTSPAQQPKDYTYQGNVCSEVGYPGISGKGNWWKMYQPVTFSVCDNGQTWLGTKAELESMCATAEKYGVKVIVDIVANHLGNIKGWQNSMTDISPQVGEYWSKEMMTDPTYWHINDLQIWMSDGRKDVTQGTMGMPDLNTGDKRVQKFVYDYLDELIDCGVDGFRFDAAKHIETDEDDPEFASDFWNTVLGEARSHYTEKTGDTLYVYGEVLNRIDELPYTAYTKNMSITDNSAGDHFLETVKNGQICALGSCFPIDDSQSVVWAESHDTYISGGGRYCNDDTIIKAWGMIGSKANVASLFLARPYYSKDVLIDDTNGNDRKDTGDNLEPALMGKCETYTWASKEVAAINHFNNYYSSQASDQGNEGNIGYCRRGDGMVIINLDGEGSVSVAAHGLPAGTYKDEVSGNTFTSDGSTVTGEIGSTHGVAVLYKGVRANPSTVYPVDLRSNQDDGSNYYTDKLKLKLTARYADNATYECSTGEKGTFKDQDIIRVGEGVDVGESFTITLTGSNARGTYTETYTYTKQDVDLDECIFFTTNKKWVRANAYIYHAVGEDTDKTLSGWPGNAMFEYGEDAQGNTIYALEVPEIETYNSVIFNNNVAELNATLGEYGQLYDESTGTWSDYYTPDPTSVKIEADVQPCEIHGEKQVTFTAANAESATYSLDGAAPVSFQGSVTLTLGTDKEEGDSTTVKIEATKGEKTKKKIFTYTIGENVPLIDISEESKSFTESFDVTVSADNVTEATYQLNDEAPVAFTGNKTITIGDNAKVGELISLTVSGKSANGITTTLSRGYVKTGTVACSDIFYKNTDSWENVYAYMWNASSKENNAAWPGVKMEVSDADDGIYKIAVPEDTFDHIIFNSGVDGNYTMQTKDLELPSAGMLYNAGVWEDYAGGIKPVISASLDTGNIEQATEVTYKVEKADSCTYKFNDGKETEFSDSVTLKVGEGLSKGQADNVIIKAVNGDIVTIKSYTYKISDKPNGTVTPKPTVTQKPTVTPEPTVTESVTPIPTITEVVTVTPVITEEVSPTPTITGEVTVTPVITEEVSPTPAITGEVIVTPAITEEVSPTPTITGEVTVTPVITEEVSPTPAITGEVTVTPMITEEVSPTPTITGEVTAVPTQPDEVTVTPTLSATPEPTTEVTATPTIIGEVTVTPELTSTPTPTQAQVTATVVPAKSVTVRFDVNGGKSISNKRVNKTVGSELGTLPVTTKSGYTFAGWYTKRYSGTKVSSNTKVTKNVTYYAHWEKLPGKVSVTVKAKAKKKNQIRWSKAKEADGYRIYRSTKKNSGYKLIKTVSASKTTYTDTKVKSGKRYYYYVKAYKKVNGKKVCGKSSNKASKVTK